MQPGHWVMLAIVFAAGVLLGPMLLRTLGKGRG